MEDQIILIDKPAGISSFGVVAKIRGKLKAEFGHKVKVGHTGTLDPFATGLLILLSGKMTKKSNEFLKLDKVYEATLKLGYTSTTGDPEGKIQQHPNDGPPEPGKARVSAPRPWRRAEATQPEKELSCIPDVIVADVSFLSLTKILEYAKNNLASKHTEFLVMLKPQFEAAPHQLNKGVVKNEKIRREIIKNFEFWLKTNNFLIVKKRDNDLRGKTGNLERFYYLKLAR